MVGVLLLKPLFRGGMDFHVFYLSGQRALIAAPIYLVSDGWMTYKYHPVWAAVFSVLSPLPERLCFVLFDAVMFCCWAWAAGIWARWLGYDIRRPTNFLVLMLVCFNALSSELNFGQINGMLFLGATKTFEWMSANRQRWFLAGLLVAVLCSLKLNFGLLAVFCIGRNFRTLLGMVTGLIGLHAITAAYFGGWASTDLYLTWIGLLLSQSAGQFTDPDVQGLLRFLLSVSSDYGRQLWLISVFFAVAGGLLMEQRQHHRPALIASYWLSAIYLLSPLAWWNQILFTLPLAFLLLRSDISHVGRGVLRASLAVYALASPTSLSREGIEMFRTYHGFFFASAAIVAVMVASLWRWSPAASLQQVGIIDP
jgi:Glycosyltransferase family 87